MKMPRYPVAPVTSNASAPVPKMEVSKIESTVLRSASATSTPSDQRFGTNHPRRRCGSSRSSRTASDSCGELNDCEWARGATFVHAMCRARSRKITAHTSKPWSVVAKLLSKTANLSAVLVRATMPGVIFTPRATRSRPQISTKRSESAPARDFLAEARVSPHALPIAATPAQHSEQADRPRSRMLWLACSEGSPMAARNASRAAARYVHSTSP